MPPRGWKRAFDGNLTKRKHDDGETKLLVGKPIAGGLKHKKVKHDEPDPIPVPDHLFDLHTMGAFVGAVKSGKTNAAVNLAHEYVRYGCFTRIFIMCPSWESNGPLFLTLPVVQEDIYKDIATVHMDIEDIIHKIKKDAEMYETHKRYWDIYHRWLQGEDDAFDEAILKTMNYEEPIDPGEKPSNLLIMDDLSHSPVYQSQGANPFTNLSLRHRHLHGVGLTIFNLTQTFRGGVPLAIRRSTMQFFLFRTEDQDDIRAMYTEVGNMVDFNTFVRLFRAATEEPHSFLTVDKWRKQFRKNFDTLLTPTDPTSEETENPEEDAPQQFAEKTLRPDPNAPRYRATRRTVADEPRP